MEPVESPCGVRPFSPNGSVLGVDALGAEIVALAGRLAAATCRWLLMVAEFDARDGCAGFGLASTGQWLAHACGLALRTATDHVRVARALAAHPRLAAAMTTGRLSYSHVRAISRVAGPEEHRLVEDLVNTAEHATVRELESVVRGLREVGDMSPAGPPEEFVAARWSADAQWRLSARLDPERGALVEFALAEVARAEGLSAADALVRLAEIGLAALADGSEQPRSLRGDERAAVVVHLDASRVPPETSDGAPAAASARSRERARPYARIAGGPGLPDRVVERLLCSGRIRTVVREGPGERSNVLELGRSHRVVSDRQFRAMLLRDSGCTHPGCTSRRGLEAHHVRHWIRGGATDLANLVLLCRRHHHAHHDGEFAIVPLGRGRFRFVRADGVELPDRIDPSALITTAAPLEAEHPDVAADAATPRRDGSRLNRKWVVAGLAQHLRRRDEPPPRAREPFDPWAVPAQGSMARSACTPWDR